MAQPYNYTKKDTLKSLYTIADKSNVFAAVISVVILFFCIVKEIESALQAESSYYVSASTVLFSLAYSSLVYSLLLPSLKIRKYPHGRSISNMLFALLTLLLVITISLILIRTNAFSNIKEALQGTLGVVAAIAVITGWIVNHQITSTNNRVNQTLNLILQTRISSVYQEHEQNVRAVYGRSVQILKEDVEEWLTNPKTISDDSACTIGTCNKKEALLTKKDKTYKALVSCCYILNYYEFLASGVSSGLLDEELLYQTVGGMLLHQLKQKRAIIEKFREESKKSLEHLMTLESRWRPRHEMEEQLKRTGI